MKAECEKFGEVRKVIVFDVSVSHLGTRCKVYKHIFKLMLLVIQSLVGISQESYDFVKLYLLCCNKVYVSSDNCYKSLSQALFYRFKLLILQSLNNAYMQICDSRR